MKWNTSDIVEISTKAVITALISVIAVHFLLISCSTAEHELVTNEVLNSPVKMEQPEDNGENPWYQLPDIDLSHWKVTLPVGENGKPKEIKPPEILDYATNEALRPFMYNDSTDGSLVFYTYPGVTTTNSTRSRTELREQMEPGSNSVNWTFTQGGRMKATLAMDSISRAFDGNYHRTIVLQIHGRLTNEQRDLIGEDDNNAPPILKIAWSRGRVRLYSKILTDPDVSDIDILKTGSWANDEPYNFEEAVGFDKFTVEIIASQGRMEVILNDNESVVYEGEHMVRWGIFENYFKAGNYLQTSDEGAFAKVKFYHLEVEH